METQNFILEGCKREVAITFSAPELQPHYDKAYQTAQPEIQVQGFRKGKVPLNIIKKKFGQTIENDAVEGIANEAFQQFIQSENLNPIGRPALRDIQRESDGSMKFTIAYEVLPEFALGNYRGLEIRKVVHEVTDEDVEREIDGLTERFAAYEPAEQITDDTYVATVQFRTLDEQTGMPLLGGEPEEYNVYLKREPANSDIKASLLNTKVGDTFNHLLPDRENPDVQHRTIATVKDIQRVIPAEFDNEFVEKVTNGKFTTTEELREEYTKQIIDFWKDLGNRNTSDQIVGKLLEMHEFEPPQSLVQEVITSMLRQDVERLPDKKLPPNFDIQSYVQRTTPVAANTAKWMIIREKIVDAENIKVEDADIDKHTEELAGQMGVDANFEYIRSAIAASEELQNRLLHDKVMDVLRDYAVITEVEDSELAAQEAEA